MSKKIKVLLISILFILLTVLSQVGGIILLLWLFLFSFFKKKIQNSWAKRAANIFGFMAFYMIFNVGIIPVLASFGGKTRLPMSKSGNVVPVTYWTAIFMRNYITVEGKENIIKLSEIFAKKYPGLKVKYMDCNYPFYIPTPTYTINGKSIETFPLTEGLIPHITHCGNKADIAFVYNDENDNPSNLTPTAIGYGSSVDPRPNEPCTPCMCEKNPDNWQYSLMYHTLPKRNYSLNDKISSELVRLFKKKSIGTIFIEKHLVARFKLFGNYSDAGCHSVRHDDHFHVEMGGIK